MALDLRFDDQVVVVTGAGGGLGRSHALSFAAKGAKVVVNDLGGGFNGDGSPKPNMADAVVQEIQSAGGVAIADYHSVAEGDKIIETAVKAFGTVHVLVNNAGILRDIAFRNMKDKDWDLIQQVHMFGTFATTRAAWPWMCKQKYGRILNTASGAGTYGSFGQTNYCAAKAAIIGFTFALAKEGARFNITANVITPIAASRLTATVMSADLMAKLSPEWVAPIVPALTYSGCSETGGLFDVGAGCITKFRWERSVGARFSGDLQPRDVVDAWGTISDFSSPSYDEGLTQQSPKTKEIERRSNSVGANKYLDGRVALVTGGGSGFGRQTALTLAAAGTKVIVNDKSPVHARSVVQEIKQAGGQAIAESSPAEETSQTVKTGEQVFGKVDIVVIANTPSTEIEIPLDQISDKEWAKVYNSTVRDAYKVLQAAWSGMLKNHYGRVVLVSSHHGLYGQSQSSHFSAATMGIVGFMRALFREGQKYNIRVNVLALPPTSSTISDSISAAVAACLSSDEIVDDNTGGTYSVLGNHVSKVRWQRSFGHSFSTAEPLTPERVVEKWSEIVTFDERADHPESSAEGMLRILEHAGQKGVYQPKQRAAKQQPSSSKL